VTRSFVFLLLLLSSIWGSSYLFIKVAVRQIDPSAMIEFRLLIASALLFGFLTLQSGVRRALGEVRDAWRPALVLGIVNAAIPYTLIAWGETHIDSGVAAIANAPVPLFVALLAVFFRPSEKVGGIRLIGILIGFVGVGVLAGVHPKGGSLAVLGTLAVVAAAFSYSIGQLYAQHSIAGTRGPVLATASMLGGALVLLPLALFQLPTQMPGWKSLGSLLALAVVGTAVAQIFLFRMIRLHGPSRSALVTYLLPLTALVYGAVFLSESLTAAKVGGMALILAGVALGSGLVRGSRRGAAVQTPP
jgi:drug/metabolite transporter (DMT)-like permease